MTDRLQPYPAMRDSGVEWLGEVPKHWRALPNRAIFAEVKESGHSDEKMLSVTISNGVIRQDELLASSSKKDQSRIDRSMYKLVQPEEIVYNKMRAWQGAIGVSEYRGIVSPAYIVQRPLSSIYAQYAHHLFRTPAFAKEVERCSYGITSDMWSLRPEDFKTICVCVPPLSEQTAIARFLDHINDQINRYIRAKEKLIALLEEQKQAIVHQAVTGRIDVHTGRPYPAYKPSGIEWLGDVPAHWEVKRLRMTTSIVNGATPSTSREEYWDGEIIWLTPEDLGALESRRITDSARKITPKGLESCGTSLVESNSIIISTRAPIGHLGILSSSGCSNQGCRLLVPDEDIDSEYLYSVLEAARSELQSLGQGTTFAELSKTKLGNFRTPIPPLPEQNAIACYLDRKMKNIASSITRSQRQIDLFHEYRTRLIADVVTGKLDVRSAAAELPVAEPVVDEDTIDAVQGETGFRMTEERMAVGESR